ncbi:hypothetical protein [Mesorhizobium sp. M7A.F.Ca.ET.027.03.2.1]|uniref:hypothetical protein n=1 Tax=Mesorhizobium sp. M7A.F.Ca.ET.027.03.2.1 TaxID=2496656 RepID=UPI000FC9E714|nr:hypothetical protein [Mesorhizobium sp. M7A.F.Ca.ET.027.03.2.1]RVD66931.1 hypothetical protein EN750_01010 [Mesorhizobium sp. M7A.F.Ca.ET.027.03.2.1]
MIEDDISDGIDPAYFLQFVCSPEEYPRILRPKNADDFLLRVQADAITDHARIFRVMQRRAIVKNLNTMLIDKNQRDFSQYLSYMPEFERLVCTDIPGRYILTNNYDAMCLKSEFGKVIVVSEVLRYFLYYMNLGTLAVGDVPASVRSAATLIAIRTLLLSEALDFDLDPRGMIPQEIHATIEGFVDWQMKFIIGHEYAHHILNHSSEETSYISSAKRFSDGDDLGEWVGYKRRHSEEFEADAHSIIIAEDKENRYSLFVGGTSFLLGLYVFEIIAGKIDPSFLEINTHPNTTTRYRKLIEKFECDETFMIDGVDRIIDFYESIANDLLDHYQAHPDAFTRYGSMYLAEWRGPILKDRVDY